MHAHASLIVINVCFLTVCVLVKFQISMLCFSPLFLSLLPCLHFHPLSEKELLLENLLVGHNLFVPRGRCIPLLNISLFVYFSISYLLKMKIYQQINVTRISGMAYFIIDKPKKFSIQLIKKTWFKCD